MLDCVVCVSYVPPLRLIELQHLLRMGFDKLHTVPIGFQPASVYSGHCQQMTTAVRSHSHHSEVRVVLDHVRMVYHESQPAWGPVCRTGGIENQVESCHDDTYTILDFRTRHDVGGMDRKRGLFRNYFKRVLLDAMLQGRHCRGLHAGRQACRCPQLLSPLALAVTFVDVENLVDTVGRNLQALSIDPFLNLMTSHFQHLRVNVRPRLEQRHRTVRYLVMIGVGVL